MSYLDDAVDFIARFEGKRNEPYHCSAGVLTVGYGHTGNVEDRYYSDAECEELLRKDVKRFDASLDHMVKVPLSGGQRIALLSLVFNIGVTALSKSTLLKKLNRGDYHGAGGEFVRWNKAGGKVLAGLVRRREAEADRWAKG